MTRLVCINFEQGRISAWCKVPGGPVHRVRVVDQLDAAAMRQCVYEPQVVEQFRQQPYGVVAGVDKGDGGEVA